MIMEFVLQRCVNAVDLQRALDGEEAVSILKVPAMSIDHPRPDLVLLDLNLPRIDGFEVLEFIKSQDFIRDVPVVIFTSSANEHDARRAQELGAEEFITKPINLDNMLEVPNRVCSRYLNQQT